MNGRLSERIGIVFGVARAAEAVRLEWVVDRRVLPARGCRSIDVLRLDAGPEKGAIQTAVRSPFGSGRRRVRARHGEDEFDRDLVAWRRCLCSFLLAVLPLSVSPPY